MNTLTTMFFALLFLTTKETNAFDSTMFKNKITNKTHQIKILNHGLASFEERLQMVDRAEKTIDVEYFMYEADTAGRMFTQALINKAKAGVKVRIILDYILVKRDITPFHAHELAKYGIEVKYFNPTATIFGKGQYRDHRKLIVIDQKEAMTGGRNLGDEYFDLKEKFNYIDRDIEVKGPIVDSMLASYNKIWNAPETVAIARPKLPQAPEFLFDEDYEQKLEQYKYGMKSWKAAEKNALDFLAKENLDLSLLDSIRAKGKEELQLEYQGECQNMAFITEDPATNGKAKRIIKFDFFERMKNAKESVLIESPYFINDKDSAKALEVALKNKIDLKILTNGIYSSDAIYVFNAFIAHIKKWVKRGLKPYVFKGEPYEGYTFLNDEIAKARFGTHAKTFIFDNKDVVIGSFNYDPRSLNYSNEIVIVCEDNPELASAVRSDIESRMKSSIDMSTENAIANLSFYRASFFKLVGYVLLKIPANLFDFML